ncbi:alcohol dehydrogenase catalytic domain-containing protein [Neobacillus niacini]|uniref:alcohol dehydrogenase catalytic domain-containing protein n=1 Tax=Neobacillus niacini TaxID=86668 RepID=UPI0030022EE0
MKAVVLKKFGDIDNLSYEDVADPVCLDYQVLIRMHACGVCHHDVMKRKGHFPRTQPPVVMGHEIAGEIMQVGKSVTNFQVGDRVVSVMRPPCGTCRNCRRGYNNLCQEGGGTYGEKLQGGYAEFVVLNQNGLIKIPDNIGYPEASIIPCALGTAYHAIRSVANVKPSETVIITGASGGVGIHAIQFARLVGARVIAVTTSPSKVNVLKEIGADEVIVSPELQFDKEARALTNGIGADVILDIVGELAWESGIKSIAYRGRYIFIGNLNGNPVQLRPAHAILKELSFLGTDAVTVMEVHEIMELVKLGRIQPIVEEKLPLKEAGKAHQLLEQKKTSGRVVLTL